MAKTRDKSPTFYQFSFWSRVEEYARPLVESEEFLLLKKATVVDLLQRNLEVAETTIFKRVVAWGEAECERYVPHFFRSYIIEGRSCLPPRSTFEALLTT